MIDMDQLPAPLAKIAQRFNTQWQAAVAESAVDLQPWLEKLPPLQEQLTRTVVGSHYVAQQLLAEPELLSHPLGAAELDYQQYAARTQLQAFLRERLAAITDPDAFDRALRIARRDFMLRIIWRELNRLGDMQAITGELSDFADLAVAAALNFHYRRLAERWGWPVGEDSGQVQPLLVLGMGKLGARELNLSSDIDLIFAYPEAGQLTGGKKELSNQEFFIRLGQQLIKSLDQVTAEGFVFRVDMRLRPYGQSGPLVMNFDALENYYQTQGREWERYAMIKARVVAASDDQLMAELASATPVCAAEAASRELMATLAPFTYRRYLDYSAIDSLRAMKALITREVARKGMKNDVKLGGGGIREVEFIVQAFQLIRGGRDPRLQERQLLKVLPLLVEDGCLPEGIDTRLAEAYVFLRNTEHAIQAYQDKQTQSLPVDADEQCRLAWSMGFDSWDSFVARLDSYRDFVNEQFQAVIADPEAKQQEQHSHDSEWGLIWQARLDGEAAEAYLRNHGIEDAAAVLARLAELRESRPVMAMQATARERLDHLMPIILEDLRTVDNPDQTLTRICQVLEAVARRSAYIVLLLENPPARVQLSRLCSASPWIAQQLADYPVLLDELLDVRTLYSPPDLATLQDELRREVLRHNWDDLEAHMETLRHFRLSHSLRVAACEVTEVLPLMKASDYLTYIAEVILQHVLDLAWQQMVGRYGLPGKTQGSAEDPDFVVVGYGKLGGIELGHGSDLDLVFIHNSDMNLATDGPRQIDNATFFTRLGQKVIHILNTQTFSGQLYEVDMRLRPSGNSGLLVSSLAAFEKYQRSDAWVWEHQALVRARVVAGSPLLGKNFEALRETLLCEPRDLAELRREVVAMREKMRQHLSSSGDTRGEDETQFHIKQDAGGIVDIEFMVQYAVLAWAHQHPALVRYTDNIRIIGSLQEAQLLSADTADQLIDAYKTYRSAVHRLALQDVPAVVPGDRFTAERATVSAIWQQLMAPADEV